MAYEYTHMFYLNKQKRNEAYLKSIAFAVRYIKQTYVFNNFLQFSYKLKNLSNLIQNERYNDVSLDKFVKRHLLDHILIILSFENYLKGVLIKKGYGPFLF